MRPSRPSTAAALALALLAALASGTAARADDGVREIHQACAATGCFPGDAPGFPVQIAAPGSYALTGDLTVPAATNGIEIAADEVTLDLRGFRLQGPYGCGIVCLPGAGTTGFGVTAVGSGGDYSRVRNGIVRGFPLAGVALGDHARVEALRLAELGQEGAVLGNYGMAFDNTVSQVAGNGLELGTGSLYRGNSIDAGGPISVAGGRASGPNFCTDRRCGTDGKRFFFLTNATANGANADQLCGAGFHFASYFELSATSDLEYDTSRGFASGNEGPPTASGWARSGTGTSSVSNCSAWNDAVGSSTGTTVSLDQATLQITNPTQCTADDAWIWDVQFTACDQPVRVWCIQD